MLRGRPGNHQEIVLILTGGVFPFSAQNPSNALGQLFGGGVVAFPVLQQFNTFASARMTVTLP